MCDPFTITAVAVTAGLAQAGAGIAGAVGSQESRKAQKRLAAANADLQKAQVRTQVSQEADAAAEKNLELARGALAAKGAAQASNLGERSVRAISRSIGFELGQDRATVEKNVENANLVAASRLRGIDITLASQKAQIGDTSGLTLGLDITGSLLSGLTTGLTIGSGLTDMLPPSTPAGTSGPTQVSQLGSGTDRVSNIA